MPSKPQPFRLPQRFDSPTLAKLAIAGEPTVIVRAVGVGSTAPFEYSDRNGRQAIFRYDQKYDAHVLKVPASIWNANKGFMAHELMDQRRLPHPLVVTVEVPTPTVEYAQTQESPKSQDGQAAKSSGPYPETEGSSPSPATTFEPPQEGTPEPISPEMDAPGKSEEASDVVVGQVSEQPGASASETFSSPETQGGSQLIYSAAWDKLESPMRLKELAAELGTDADTLKAALQDPLSTVELGRVGWVKRREPKA